MDKKMMTIIAVIAVVAIVAIAAVVLLNNGNSDNNKSGDDDKGKAVNVPCDPYTVTDLAGQTITLDHTLGAVATQWSISGGPFITMLSLLGDDVSKYLVGMDSTPPQYRADSWEAYCKNIPGLSDLEIIGGIGSDFDPVKVLSLNPNALIISKDQKKSAEDNNVVAQFTKANIPVIYVDFHSQDVQKSADSIRLIGKLFGKEKEGEALAQFYESKCNAVYDKVADILASGKERPDVYIEVGQNGPSKHGNSHGNKYMWGGIVYNCGGNSLYTGTETTAGAMDDAFVLNADPDKILFTGSLWPGQSDSILMGFTATESIVKERVDAYFTERAGWSSLSAYKSDEVYAIYHSLSRDAYDYVAIEYIAKMIWPDEFADLDPMKDLQEFYKKYIGFDIYGTWVYHHEVNGSGGDDNAKAVNQPCAPYTVTDLAGQTFTFDHTFGAVATQWSISGGPFITMLSLLGDDVSKYLVGMDSTPPLYRADSWEAYCNNIPGLSDLEIIGGIGSDFDPVKVLSLNPNALIISKDQKKSAEDNNVVAQFNKANIPVIYIDFHSQDVQKSADSIRLIGKLFGKEKEGNALAAYYEGKCNAVYDKVAEILASGKERPDVYIEVGQNGPSKHGNSHGNKYMWGGIVYNCGGNSVFTGSETTAAAMDDAYVLTSDPDKILFTGSLWPGQPDSILMGFTATESVLKERIEAYFSERPGWSSLSAYKNDEVYSIYHSLSRDAYDFVAIEYIAKMIWPDEFADLDPMKDLQEFYKEYIGFDLYGIWVYHL